MLYMLLKIQMCPNCSSELQAYAVEHDHVRETTARRKSRASLMLKAKLLWQREKEL